jgi:hypothetical protein
MGNNRSGCGQALFRKEPGHLAELLVAALQELLHRLLL